MRISDWSSDVCSSDLINALLKLINEGEDALWKKKGIEKQLHNLLKEQPWLIRPEYSRYLTSDQDLSRVSTALAKHLGVDEFAAMNDLKLPDLVFVMSDAGVPNRINVIELKSPSLRSEAHTSELRH